MRSGRQVKGARPSGARTDPRTRWRDGRSSRRRLYRSRPLAAWRHPRCLRGASPSPLWPTLPASDRGSERRGLPERARNGRGLPARGRGRRSCSRAAPPLFCPGAKIRRRRAPGKWRRFGASGCATATWIVHRAAASRYDWQGLPTLGRSKVAGPTPERIPRVYSNGVQAHGGAFEPTHPRTSTGSPPGPSSRSPGLALSSTSPWPPRRRPCSTRAAARAWTASSPPAQPVPTGGGSAWT
jgi:hypothetical protein